MPDLLHALGALGNDARPVQSHVLDSVKQCKSFSSRKGNSDAR